MTDNRYTIKCFGYSLIELLVVISIIIILSGIGIANYIDVNRTQEVAQQSKKIFDNLRYAQSLANNNQKVDECLVPYPTTTPSGPITYPLLNGYKYTIASGVQTIKPVCSNLDKTAIKTENIYPNMTVTGISQVFFKVLWQPSVITGGSIITVTAYGKSRYITVCPSGEITYSELSPIPTPCP